MTSTSSIYERMLGALRLDAATYEQIEADEKATGEAAFVVVASAIVAAAGYALALGGTVNAGLLGAIAELIGWAIFAWVSWLVGTKLIPGQHTKSSWGEIARTTGYAHMPRFLLILVAIPGIIGIVRVVVAFWILAAAVVALRQALDITTMRAVVVGAIALLVQYAVASFIIGSIG